MAIYHCSVKTISRGQGRSAVAAAAYQSADKITNERDGITHDFTNKQGVEYTEIMTPENAPEWAKDRSKLWNEVEKAETRINSRTAREVELAVPNELTPEQQKQLVKEYVQENFVDRGMVADLSYHNKEGNPHYHVLLTTREIDENGFTTKNRDWDKKESLELWRENWSKSVNRELERKGHEIKIDHRSYLDQGIDQVPTIHMGVAATAMERRGIKTDKGLINREINSVNRMTKMFDRQAADVKEIEKIDLGKIEHQRAAEPRYRTVAETVSADKYLQEIDTYKDHLTVAKEAQRTVVGGVRQEYDKLLAPYHEKAIESHLMSKWGKEWQQVQLAKSENTLQRQRHNDNRPNGWLASLSGKIKEWERAGGELERQSCKIDRREEDLRASMARLRGDLQHDLKNPRAPQQAPYADRHEVDIKIQDALHRDPPIAAKAKALEEREKSETAKSVEVGMAWSKTCELSNTLGRMRDRSEVDVGREVVIDKDGKRLSMAETFQHPEFREKLGQEIKRVSENVKNLQQERSRGKGLGLSRSKTDDWDRGR